MPTSIKTEAEQRDRFNGFSDELKDAIVIALRERKSAQPDYVEDILSAHEASMQKRQRGIGR